MLKKILIPVLGSLAIFYAGCKPSGNADTKDGIVLSKNIEYDVTINNFNMSCMSDPGESNFMWYRNNLEGSVRSGFLEMLFKKAFSGKLDLYDMDDNPIDTIALRKLLSSTDTVMMIRVNPPFDEYDTVLTTLIEPYSITGLRFREEWNYDPKTLAITKKVTALAPIMTSVTYDENYNETFVIEKPLFWVKFSEDAVQHVVLTKRIVNGVTYSGPDKVIANEADAASIEKYMGLLLNKVFADSITAYDPAGSPMPNEPMSGKECKGSMHRVDTITMKNASDPGKTYDSIVKDNAIISNLRFLEEWTLDTLTMNIQKKIVGICPVEVCYDDEGYLKGFKPNFWVYFDDVWMPFNKKLELKKAKK